MLYLSGLLGVPAPNGLIPQAPMHTQALVVMGVRRKDDPEKPPISSTPPSRTSLNHNPESNPEGYELRAAQNYEPPHDSGDKSTGTLVEEHPVSVVEQRVSNLVQGALCVVLMTGPFQHVLGLVPRGVLAGLL